MKREDPPPTFNSTRNNRYVQGYWKQFKSDVEKFCEIIDIDNLDSEPNLAYGEYFMDIFLSLRENQVEEIRKLTENEYNCLREKIALKWGKILSKKSEIIKAKFEDKSYLEDSNFDLSDSDDCIIEPTSKKSLNETDILENYDLEDSDDSPLASTSQKQIENTEFNENPSKKPRLSKAEFISDDDDIILTNYIASTSRPTNSLYNSRPSSSNTANKYHSPDKDLKKKNEPRFEASKPESAQCPICDKYFDEEYIFEHSSNCAIKDYIDPSERRSIQSEDLKNRRYTKKRRINPITGREEFVKTNNWNDGPFRANEEEIQDQKLGNFQRTLNKSPQPVRTMYPHFDRPNEPISKCPMCAFTYLSRELSTHTSKCADSMYGNR